MNKSEFVEAIASGMGGTKVDASRFLEIFQMTITDALKKGDQIMIPGFGSFSVVMRAARTGVNPKNGQKLQIKATRVPKFKAGKSLKEAVQD
jgi:DNA-binding protein HU-beta